LSGAAPIRLDPFGTEIDVTSDCAIVDRLDVASERLFAVGPLTRVAFWEIVAVPDIRTLIPRNNAHRESKALVHLATLQPRETVQVMETAEAHNIPKKFLDAILGDLRKPV
jgi:uncharacterized NAD(P)/FAD-binding protein YdhS